MQEFKPIIATYSGIYFNLDEPEFDVNDIAHALSNVCRYAGHCNRFYSVAEHSVLVSWLMEELKLGTPLHGLMHDGHEAYLSDVPSPFKQRFPDWCAADNLLEEQLLTHFGCPFPRETGVKEADLLAFFIEKDALFKPGQAEGFNTVKYPELAERSKTLMREGWHINCWTPEQAKEEFLSRYEQLQEQTGAS